jgi:hypothetical protein
MTPTMEKPDADTRAWYVAMIERDITLGEIEPSHLDNVILDCPTEAPG